MEESFTIQSDVCSITYHIFPGISNVIYHSWLSYRCLRLKINTSRNEFTTNIFAGDLNPQIKSDHLLDRSKHLIKSSVKWPRGFSFQLLLRKKLFTFHKTKANQYALFSLNKCIMIILYIVLNINVVCTI